MTCSPVNRFTTFLIPNTGINTIKWIPELIPKTTAVESNKSLSGFPISIIIHGPTPVNNTVKIRRLIIKARGSQARRSEGDGSIVLLITTDR